MGGSLPIILLGGLVAVVLIAALLALGQSEFWNIGFERHKHVALSSIKGTGRPNIYQRLRRRRVAGKRAGKGGSEIVGVILVAAALALLWAVLP